MGSGVRLPAGFPAGQVDTGASVDDVPNRVSGRRRQGRVRPEGRPHPPAQYAWRRARAPASKTYSLDADTTFGKTGDRRRADRRGTRASSPRLRLIGTAFFSSGGGRYIANTLPDFIGNHDQRITLVNT